MLELSGAYLVAAALIGTLIFLGRRNQKQGWRRERRTFWEALPQPSAAREEPAVDIPLEHFSDLRRLKESLAGETKTVPAEETVKSR